MCMAVLITVSGWSGARAVAAAPHQTSQSGINYGLPPVPDWTHPDGKHPNLRTRFGVVTTSSVGFTRSDLCIALQSRTGSHRLWKIPGGSWHKLQEWQTSGPYLAVQVGNPPSGQPQTGDYSEQQVVFDLATGKRVYTSPTGIGTTVMGYLADPYYVMRWWTLRANGTVAFYTGIVDLHRGRYLNILMPSNVLTLGEVIRGRLYYVVSEHNKPTVQSEPLPVQGWRPI